VWSVSVAARRRTVLTNTLIPVGIHQASGMPRTIKSGVANEEARSLIMVQPQVGLS